MHSLRIRG
ncbi:unnamed protein product [Cuscuta europaea]|uniref:Uncharacterized protein n=1 Tax=Cuscuta europaea TaxID=41803 RepID=A0A9P0YTS6_CUSEU|nr:unnamed protein product [Cuscuta europaea]